jgi:hypothetical protein
MRMSVKQVLKIVIHTNKLMIFATVIFGFVHGSMPSAVGPQLFANHTQRAKRQEDIQSKM